MLTMMNGAEVCLITRRTVFNMYICLFHNTMKLKGVIKNQDQKFFENGENALLVAFLRYTQSQFYSHFTRNDNFQYIL